MMRRFQTFVFVLGCTLIGLSESSLAQSQKSKARPKPLLLSSGTSPVLIGSFHPEEIKFSDYSMVGKPLALTYNKKKYFKIGFEPTPAAQSNSFRSNSQCIECERKEQKKKLNSDLLLAELNIAVAMASGIAMLEIDPSKDEFRHGAAGIMIAHGMTGLLYLIVPEDTKSRELKIAIISALTVGAIGGLKEIVYDANGRGTQSKTDFLATIIPGGAAAFGAMLIGTKVRIRICRLTKKGC